MSEPTRTIGATRVATLVGVLRPQPRLRRAGRRPGPARRGRAHPGGDPAAERARPHRGAARLAHHRDPRLRRCSARPGTPRPAGARAPSPRVPGGRARVHDRALLPRPGDHDAIDLGCAATSAPPGIAAAYAEAAAELPAYLGGHGYYPSGLPTLQAAIARSYDDRGLPTDPDQIMVTPGALTATSIVARALTGPRNRVLVESPVYPNATQAIRNSGARVVGSPVDPEGWDLPAIGTVLREVVPTLAYLIPDFQNPTGHLMSEDQREEYAGHLRRTGTVAVVDEAHQALALDGQQMPRPFAAFAPTSITVGSASKSFWGGLRLGWIRAPRERMDALTHARLGLDLGSPVLEQLVLARLLADPAPVVTARRERLREQRDRLLDALAVHLPSWTFVRPGGGLAVWCQLPEARRDRAGRRGRAARRDRVTGPGLRRRGRSRPVRADPLLPAGRRARGGDRPAGPRVGRRRGPGRARREAIRARRAAPRAGDGRLAPPHPARVAPR